MSAFARGGFYAILNLLPPADGWWPYLPAGKRDPWPDAHERAQALLASTPCCLQIRAKEAPAALLYSVAMQLRSVCHDAGVPLCINDRVDVAIAVGANLAHLGQSDLTVVDARRVIEVISQGAAQSWQMDNRSETMLDGEFDFGFAVDWMRKDLGIALAEAERVGAKLQVAALVDGFYAEVQAAGGGRSDTSSLKTRLK